MLHRRLTDGLKAPCGTQEQVQDLSQRDRPWGTITAYGHGQRRIAVIKDSEGNAFIPFLLPHCKEIYVIDPRQFRQPLADFVRKHGIHELLVLNNAEVASHTGYTRLLESLY